MNTLIAVVAQALGVLIGVLGLALWLRHRLPERWPTWLLGGLSFVGSQVTRLPLLGAFAAAVPLLGIAQGSLGFTLLVGGVQLATSGLFEESARYIVMRWLAKHVRAWRNAVMFGAGHGGTEALLILGFSAINNIVLLLNGDTVLAQVRATAPQQADALAAQIAALRAAPAWQFGIGLYERALAIILHIALSILVMKAVRGDGAKWLFLAMGLHIAVNTIVVLIAQNGGVLWAEAVLTVLTALPIYLIWRFREPASPPPTSL